MNETKDSASISDGDFALDQILNYERKFDEFGTPLLKRKSLDPSADDLDTLGGDAHHSPPPRHSGAHTTAVSHSHSTRSESSFSTTTRTTTSHGSVMRSPLSTFKLMSQTIAEYGDMIAQRRTEIAELQRANQLRITNSAYPKSASSLNDNSKTGFSENRTVSITEGVSLASVMAGEDDGDSFTERRSGGDASARKLDFAAAPAAEGGSQSGADASTPVHEDRSQSEVGLQSAAAWSRLSVRDELLTQLNGEKLRVTELTAKINEMYRLEEEQREKARDLAEANDRLEGLRDDLEEQLRATQLLNEELDKQIELKDDRIKELEEQLSAWVSRCDSTTQELYQCRADVAALLDEDAERTAQRDNAVSKLEHALATSLKIKSDLDSCETEKKGLVKQRQLLLHQRDEMVGKIATLEASVSSFRSELHVMTQKSDKMEQTLLSKEADIAHLAKLLSNAESHAAQLESELEALRREKAPTEVHDSDEVLLANEARKHLQLKISNLESALADANRVHDEYRSSCEQEMDSIRRSYEGQLDEYQTMGEKLENKLADYKSRLKTLQKTQKNGNAEVIEENESLKSLLNEKHGQLEAMQSQLTLGEQSWVQQAAILKESVQEKSDELSEVLKKLKSTERELSDTMDKLAAAQRDRVMSAPKAATELSSDQSQVLALENRIRSLSVNRKWQNTMLLFTLWIALVAVLMSYVVKFRPCTHDDYRITS